MARRSFTRREFLVGTSAIMATSVGGVQRLNASALRVLSARTFMPESMDPAYLRQLAIVAIDAAHHAGASYADIRIAEQQWFEVARDIGDDLNPAVSMWTTFTYGVRTYRNGVWAFQHGTLPTRDAVTAAARRTAKIAAQSNGIDPSRFDIAPAPISVGEWRTPVRIDPFDVPIDEQYGLLMAWSDAAERVPGATLGSRGYDGASFRWTRESRVFASTEGSLNTQFFCRAEPDVIVTANRGLEKTEKVWIDDLLPAAAGYEAVLKPDLQEKIKGLAHECVKFARLPRRHVDVGRYPLVLDGYSAGALLGQTVGQAAELDRVLRRDAGGDGSYLAPADSVLGAPQFNRLLNIKCDRPAGTLMSVQWDDEGVMPDEYQLIQEGRLVDYHTSRDSATMLSRWYEKRGQRVKSHGCVVAMRAHNPVTIRAPHLTIASGDTKTEVEDMVKGVGKGLFLRNTRQVSTMQWMMSGLITSDTDMYEINNGRIVRRLIGTGAQFATRAIWGKSLDAIGGPSTVLTSYVSVWKGMPEVRASQGVTAPAVLIKDVNVISTGRRL